LSPLRRRFGSGAASAPLQRRFDSTSAPLYSTGMSGRYAAATGLPAEGTTAGRYLRRLPSGTTLNFTPAPPAEQLSETKLAGDFRLEKVGLGYAGHWRVTQDEMAIDSCSVEDVVDFMRDHLEVDAETVTLYRTCSVAEAVKVKREALAGLDDEEDDDDSGTEAAAAPAAPPIVGPAS